MKMDFLEQEYIIRKVMEQKEMKNIQLTEKQKEAFDYMVNGKNIFLTGPGGSGKSEVIHFFKSIYNSKMNIAITSTTGISAILIGGTTLHSYLGIGLGNGTVEEMTACIMKNTRSRERWMKLEMLIIDEVSMLSPVLFDKLEKIARNVRRNKPKRLLLDDGETEKPFGGIQLVLSGDLLQLPVVGNTDSFVFDAESWKKCIDHVVELNKIMRQVDNEFQHVLNELRVGNVTDRCKKLLNSCIGVTLKNDLGIIPTRIFTTNAKVDEMNLKKLEKLGEENLYQYDMEIYFFEFVKNRDSILEKYRKSSLAPDVLQLCVGAQVMLVCNLDLENGLANGSRGVVIDFIEDIPVVRFINGQERIISHWIWEIEEDRKKQVRITQIPLRLAWAQTVHKVQGSTLDYAEIDLSNVFTYGQAYVALSRVKSVSGLSIININYESVQAHPKALQYYKNIKEHSSL
jgi:ATP-dependent DNA helicase PIF1